MRVSNSPLLRLFKRPDLVNRMSVGDWDLFVREARKAGLLARLHGSLQADGLWQYVPDAARWHFEAASTLAARQRVAVQWEITQLALAFADFDAPCILLKGAAYVAVDAPAAAGRLFNDVDLMVPKSALDRAEAALMLGGWHMAPVTRYDERYYRRWMHEIPPMTHLQRGSVLDLHHAVLPETTRARPDTALLLARIEPVAVPLAGVASNLFVLCEEDRVLHSAAHLFHDGELPHGLRDLSDIDLLVRAGATREDFWPKLIARAEALRVGRSLHHALRYAGHFLNTPVPDAVKAELGRFAPARALQGALDAMFVRALLPKSVADDFWSPAARTLAYVRAHALRMPPHLLIPHLLHKAFISPWLPAESSASDKPKTA